MNLLDLVVKKRDGIAHSFEELQFLANGAASGQHPDYQLAAWLMAAYLHPLSNEEAAWLTLAMAQSGEKLDLSGLPKPWVDKHSTGGVGDKTTLVVLPILAACGLTVVKMSGRGLGITGGTVDKLESIPGFRTDLSPDEMKAQATRIGIALTGQTPLLAPADKKLYSLRDVTGTVSSIPLIVSSILSKKIAGGAEVVVLDVKCGSGAFMKSLEQANALARALSEIGTHAGLIVKLAITDMDQPLGYAVGNALEVAEAIAVLKGESPGRFQELCLQLAARALFASGKTGSQEESFALAKKTLESGKALAKAEEWFVAQGADLRIFEEPWSFLPQAPSKEDLFYEGETGWISKVDAGVVGEVAVRLGGGRMQKEDVIDHSVGVMVRVEVGSPVTAGQKLFEVHARSQAELQEAKSTLMKAIGVSKEPIKRRCPVLSFG